MLFWNAGQRRLKQGSKLCDYLMKGCTANAKAGRQANVWACVFGESVTIGGKCENGVKAIEGLRGYGEEPGSCSQCDRSYQRVLGSGFTRLHLPAILQGQGWMLA